MVRKKVNEMIRRAQTRHLVPPLVNFILLKSRSHFWSLWFQQQVKVVELSEKQKSKEQLREMPPKLNTKNKHLDVSAPTTPTEISAPEMKQNDTAKTVEGAEGIGGGGGVTTRKQRGKVKESKEKMICKGNGERLCNKLVLDDGRGGIECEICLAWFHPDCQNLNTEAYAAVQKHALLWACIECRKYVTQFRDVVHGKHVKTSEIQGDTERLSRVEKKIDYLTKAVAEQTTLMKDAPVGEKLSKLYADAVKCGEGKRDTRKASTENIQECFEKYHKEKEEQEKRKCNLAISNLPESEAISGEERKKDDVTLLTEIIKEKLRICVNIVNVFRVGKKQDNKPRIMIATLDREESKWDVLKAAKMLRDSEDEMTKNVYINKDLTLHEREVNKRLRDEVKQRRANGEKVKIIRGKCVTISEQKQEDRHEVRVRAEQSAPAPQA